jgi:SAM-dependent methyltransferase
MNKIQGVKKMTDTKDTLRNTVQDYYAKAAIKSSSCCGPSKLYSPDIILDLPDDVANFSLGCGNPVTAADLQKGEIILDLGSGGGLDCFLSAKAVGETGHVIGVDMTPEMLDRASKSAEKMGIHNVEFRQGFLEALPVEDGRIDVVISNCVINLSPDKNKVFSEIFRALKPGGRIAVSDIVSNGKIPEEILQMKDSWSSCAAGALPFDDYINELVNAGFIEVKLAAKDDQGELHDIIPDKPLFSALITAQKP